ncbi:MAG: hypothetical protein ABW221_20510 [Vicinamibacteria bacterium]
MRFKTKDLLVTVMPRGATNEAVANICLLHTAVCINPTLCPQPSACPAHSLCGTPSFCQQPTLCQTPSVCHQPTACHSPTLCHQPTLCQQPTLCHQPTLCGPCSQLISCLGCSVQISGGCGVLNSCGPGGSACDPTIFCAGSFEPWFVEHLEDLVSLRADLKETIAQLDRIEKAGQLSSLIKTRADADALEASLTEALKSVQAAKKGLK